MRKIFFILLLIFLINNIYAQNNVETFLDINPGVIGEAMNGGLIAMNQNIFYYNPSISINDKISIEYEHKFLMNNISQYNSVFFSLPLMEKINIGLGYISQYISDIPIYPEYSSNVSFIPEGYFNDLANAFLFNFSYSYIPSIYSVYTIDAGLNLKYIYHKIYEYSGIGSGLDMGISANVYLNRISDALDGKLRYSIVIDNIGDMRIVWDTPSNHEDIKNMIIKTGVSYIYNISVLKSSLNIEVNYKKNEDISIYGLSILIDYNNLIDIFSGFNNEKDINYTINKPGIGASINIYDFHVMYGISVNDLGYNHSIGVKYIR